MKHKRRQPETQAEAESQTCYSCNKPDSETELLTIILPPVIVERQDLCPPCLAVALEGSKKIGKGSATQ